MKDKKDFVADMLKAEPDIKQVDLSRAVRDAYGKGLAFGHIRTLKEAMEKGSFERVWSELFGEEEALETAPKPMTTKTRGDRRRKTQLKGRRDLDRDKILLKGLSNHLVVYRTHEGSLHSQAFKSRDRAERLVRELMSEGVPADEIGYFRRELPKKAA